MSAPETVAFVNRRGQKLAGVLHGAPAPDMAIACHGMLSNKDSPKYPQLCERLLARGLPCLRFDFAGRGESEGVSLDMTFSNEIEDLQGAIDYLAGRGARRFAIFGSSMGGAVALLAAARDERIAALATLSAVGYPAAIAERYPRAAREWRQMGVSVIGGVPIGSGFLADALEHDVIAACGVIQSPALIVHGTHDEVIPSSDAHDIATALRTVSLLMVERADHRFTDDQHLFPVLDEVADFFARVLATPRAGRSLSRIS